MKNITILAVDDVEANRISLQYLINEYMEDINLILTSSGEDALKITYQENIDIIILDIQMPGMDGFETAQYLKSNPKTQNIPIIFLTAAFKEEEFQQKGFEIGAIDYLTKPIENHQFINKLSLYKEIIVKTKELEATNKNLQTVLDKEIALKEKIQKQQRELIEQSKMAALGEMIGNIAHQWRQPLSVISTCATGMDLQRDMGILKDSEFKDCVNVIITTTKELSKTIDSFRDFTHAESVIEFNLSEMINKCIETEKHIFELNNITFVLNLDDTINLVTLPNSLKQAFMNIIINAKEALEKSAQKRYLFVESKIEDDQAIITIKDNAGGIKEENLSKVFEPYFTTKHNAHGIGLGLNITYTMITQNMHGTLSVENNNYTYEEESYEGAVFTITLPIN